MFSGRRGLALLVVILLHVVVGWAFYTGLASRLAQTIIPPVEIAQIDKPKDVDKPPPPPPKLEEIKPYVPPPEFVDIQAPQEQTTAITQTTQVAQPAPPSEDRRGVVSRCVEARERGRALRGDDDRGRRWSCGDRDNPIELRLSAAGRGVSQGCSRAAHAAGDRRRQAGGENCVDTHFVEAD